MERPLIAVNGLALTEPKPGLRLDDKYALAIQQAGGVPVAVPPVGGPAELAALCARVDGLLLTGGDDFDTERLGLEPTHPSATVTPPAKQGSTSPCWPRPSGPSCPSSASATGYS